MKKACELCEGMATVHCESDEASLCWRCDAMVHSANFLVARHLRKLLCHVCQSPTPWSASGGKVGPAVSLCQQCVNRRICDENSGEGEEETAEEQEGDEEEMEDNQVVPWSPPPPATESSSSSKESNGGGGEAVNSRKRCRLENSSSNHPSHENNNCSPSHLTMLTTPPQKIQKTDSGRVGVCDPEVLESPLERYLREEAGSGIEMPELPLSNSRIAIDLNYPVAVDLNSSISS